jgi:DNA-directed RNA polymerase specialized sigma24 family protein
VIFAVLACCIFVRPSELGRCHISNQEKEPQRDEKVERLRALPEPQRAAIVMRELEGLGHSEIAADLSEGTVVKEAELQLENGAATFEKVELVK